MFQHYSHMIQKEFLIEENLYKERCSPPSYLLQGMTYMNHPIEHVHMHTRLVH